MPLRTVATIAVAIFLGLIAVLLVRNTLVAKRGDSPALATAAMTPIVVAALPIDRGVQLKPAMLKIVSYPKDAVPAGAFTSTDQIAARGAGGLTALRSMSPNEPVLGSKLSGQGSKATLSGTLKPGMRAVSLRSTDVTGVGGFVLPGDRVDILLTRAVGNGGDANTVTQILSENSLVVGVDQTSDQDVDKPVVAKAVTVEVTPEQAQAISLGQAVGQLSLSLRQISDEGLATRRVTTVSDLGGAVGRKTAQATAPRRAAPSTPRPAPAQVNVTRGVVTSGYPVAGL